VEGRDGEYKYIELDVSEEEYEEFKSEIIGAREKIRDVDFWRGLLGK